MEVEVDETKELPISAKKRQVIIKIKQKSNLIFIKQNFIKIFGYLFFDYF